MTIKFPDKAIAVALIAFGAATTFAGGSSAEAQTRAERAAERRAMAEQRLEALSVERGERAMRRTELFERMESTTPEMVESRITDAEARILEELADADATLIAEQLNQAGGTAETLLTSEALSKRDLDRLSDEQLDQLVVAAARAATITPDEVDAMLTAGALKVEDIVDGLDAEEMASTFNEIGAKALDLQDTVQENTPDR